MLSTWRRRSSQASMLSQSSSSLFMGPKWFLRLRSATAATWAENTGQYLDSHCACTPSLSPKHSMSPALVSISSFHSSRKLVGLSQYSPFKAGMALEALDTSHDHCQAPASVVVSAGP